MTKGFVTIATGHERYYKLAVNLRRSYRQNCENPLPFAIIADRTNKFTDEFDDVVILDNATHSWMDKMRLLDSCPYDENLFLDADCLVYQDINFLWDLFSGADDFSCFGKAYPLDAKGGWFTNQASQFYPIKFCTHLHGILYFIRKSETLARMQTLCNDIIANYKNVVFKSFNGLLADEPVYALAMAVLDLHPVERKVEHYCFVPYATEFSSNYSRRAVRYLYPGETKPNTSYIVHWGNQNTLRANYRFDAGALNFKRKDGVVFALLYRYGLLLPVYKTIDFIKDLWKKAVWYGGRAIQKIRRLLLKK